MEVMVGSNWEDGNGGTNLGANRNTDIRIQFSESMDPSSITVITSGSSCSGTIQVSDNDFATNSCVPMSQSPEASNNNKTFTVDPSGGCLAEANYKIKVTTGVKDGSGISMLNEYFTVTGFGTGKNCPSGF